MRGRERGQDRISNEERRREERFSELEAWVPRTELGKDVKAKKITDIGQVISSGKRILEPEIVDTLIPNIDVDYIMIGQSKGKFGGGKRRMFRTTQKKTREGNKPIFTVMAVVGNRNGYIGVGLGKAKETLPAREKAVRSAKMNIMQVIRGCGSWQCTCGQCHSIPFEIEGKEGSVTIRVMPAPKGTGLVVDKEIKKVLQLAGIKDAWSKTNGQSRQKINHISALIKAFDQASKTYVKEKKNMVIGAR